MAKSAAGTFIDENQVNLREDKKRALASGMNEHIAKPVDVEKIISV